MNELMLLIGPVALLCLQAAVILTVTVYAAGFMGGGSARANRWVGAVWSWIWKKVRIVGKALLKVFLKILGAVCLKVSQVCQAGVRRL